jgi:hypothetical protein
MTVFLISYDLNKEAKRPPIVTEIKSFGSWARISESSYAVETDMTAQAVYNKMAKHLDINDTLYVIKLSPPWTGQGSREVNDWLAAAFQRQAARAY